MNKRIKGLLIGLTMFSFLSKANASSVTVGRSYATITKGSYVTFYVYLNDVAAWDVKGNGSGSTSNCSLRDVGDTGTGHNGNKTLSVSCYATDLGQIGFVISGDYTTEDGTTRTISGGTSVTVVKPREKDSNNYLSSLEVEGYELSPAFDKDTLEYNVSVPSSVDKVTIKASKASNYAADPTGVGEVEVSEGSNNIEVTITSETGVNRTYKINVNVEDKNPITIKIDEESYTLMKNLKEMNPPEGFKQENIKIKEVEIPAFISEKLHITLVGIKDSKGNKMLATYDEKEQKYNHFNQNKSKSLNLFILKPESVLDGFVAGKITINGSEYDCLKKIEDENYIVVYAKDLDKAENNYYVYDIDTNSYIIYKNNIEKNHQEEIEKYKVVVYGLAIALGLSGIIIMFLLLTKTKKKKRIEKNPPKEEQVKITNQEKKAEKKEEKPKKKNKAGSKTDAIETIKDAQSIIEEYEKTMAISKEDLKKEDTEMFDILKEDKNKKRKKKF